MEYGFYMGHIRKNYKNAWQVFLRDRANHASPNAGQTEAAVAGALEIQLGGPSSYFGKVSVKPTMGDDTKSIEPSHILAANAIMVTATAIMAIFLVSARIIFSLVAV